MLGELHPLVREHYELLAAELDLEALFTLAPERYASQAIPAFPLVLENLAFIVDETLPTERVEALIAQAGGKMLAGVRLFDVYRSEQLGPGKKSLAYSLAYQAPDRTLTDQEAQQIRQRIIRRLEQELGAKLRS